MVRAGHRAELCQKHCAYAMGKGPGAWVPGPGQGTLPPPPKGAALIFPVIGLEQWERFLRGQQAQQDLRQLLPPGGGGRQDSSGLFEGNNPGFYRAAGLPGPCTWQETEGREGRNEAQWAGPPRLEEDMSALSPLSLIVTFVSLQASEQTTRLSGLAWSLDRPRPDKLFATLTLEGAALGLLVSSSRWT